MRISFPGKPRKDSSGLWADKDGTVFIGADYALQNEINEKLEKRNKRACFKGCMTCGACANSRRGCAYPRSFDANAHKTVDCRSCEPFRYHDCNNGVMRNSR